MAMAHPINYIVSLFDDTESVEVERLGVSRKELDIVCSLCIDLCDVKPGSGIQFVPLYCRRSTYVVGGRRRDRVLAVYIVRCSANCASDYRLYRVRLPGFSWT